MSDLACSALRPSRYITELHMGQFVLCIFHGLYVIYYGNVTRYLALVQLGVMATMLALFTNFHYENYQDPAHMSPCPNPNPNPNPDYQDPARMSPRPNPNPNPNPDYQDPARMSPRTKSFADLPGCLFFLKTTRILFSQP